MKYGPYSHSRIRKGHCPYAFKRRYIDKDPGISRGNASFGKAVHEIIAKVIDAQVKEDPYNLALLVNMAISHELLPRIGEIQEIMEVFRRRFEFRRDYVVGIEEPIAVDELGDTVDWDSDNAYVRGVLDIIEIDGDEAKITDHKTQFNILSKEDMKTDQQLTMYCYLAKCMYPQLKTFKVGIFFARYGVYRWASRDLEDLEKFDQALRIQTGRIEAIEEWVPIAGAGCNTCDHIHECPLAQYDVKGTDMPIITTDAQAVEQGRLIRVREEQLSKAKEQLRGYCSSNGPVQISDSYAYGYMPSETRDWPINEVKQILEQNGQTLEAVVTINKRLVEALVRQAHRLDPELAEQLEAVAVEKTDTRFKGYRV